MPEVAEPEVDVASAGPPREAAPPAASPSLDEDRAALQQALGQTHEDDMDVMRRGYWQMAPQRARELINGWKNAEPDTPAFDRDTVKELMKIAARDEQGNRVGAWESLWKGTKYAAKSMIPEWAVDATLSPEDAAAAKKEGAGTFWRDALAMGKKAVMGLHDIGEESTMDFSSREGMMKPLTSVENLLAGGTRGIAGVAPVLGGLAAETAELGITPFLSDDHEEEINARLNTGVAEAERTKNLVFNHLAEAGKPVGINKESASFLGGEQVAPILLPLGGEYEAGAKIAQASEKVFNIGEKAAGLALRTTAKVGEPLAKAVAVAGPPAIALATHHPYLAAGMALGEFGAQRALKKFAETVLDPAFQGVDNLGSAMMKHEQGQAAITYMRQQLGRQTRHVEDQIEWLGKAAGEKISPIEKEAAQDRFGQPLFSAEELENPKNAGADIRARRDMLEMYKARDTKLKGWETANVLMRAGVKFGLKTGMSSGTAGAVGAALTGATEAPGDYEEAAQGWKMGSILGLMGPSANAGMGTIMGARRGLFDHVFQTPGAGKYGDLKVDAKPFDYGHTPEVDAAHAEATSRIPADIKQEIGTIRSMFRGTAEIYVLPDDEYTKAAQTVRQDAKSNGFIKEVTDKDGNTRPTIYLKESHLSDPTGLETIWHEIKHSITDELPPDLKHDLDVANLKKNNPSEFASNYMTKLTGKPTVIDYDSLPEVNPPGSPEDGGLYSHEAVLREMRAETLPGLRVDHITKDPTKIRRFQWWLGKQMEKFGLPTTTDEARSVLGLKPSFRSSAIVLDAIKKAARERAVDVARSGAPLPKTGGEGQAPPPGAVEALMTMGARRADAIAKVQGAIGDLVAAGHPVTLQSVVAGALRRMVPEPAGIPAGIPQNVGARATQVAPRGTNVSPLVTDDVDVAAHAIALGEPVELAHGDEVSTLVNRLAEMAQDAEKSGKSAVYDLGKVSVKGTNLFMGQTRGVPRVQMPQLKGVPRPGTPADAMARDARGQVDIGPQFYDLLKKSGVNVMREDVPVSQLRPTQNELNGEEVAGIMSFLRGGGKLEGLVPVSRDNYIVDGHHRWAAEVGLNYAGDKDAGMTMPVERIDLPISEILGRARDFANDQGIPQDETIAQALKPHELQGIPKKGAGATQGSGVARPTPLPTEVQPPPLTSEALDKIRADAESATRNDLIGSRASPKTKQGRISRAGFDAMAAAHARAVTDPKIVTLRTDRFGKTQVSGQRLDFNDPFHQWAMKRAGWSDAEITKAQYLQERMGSTVGIDYQHAPTTTEPTGITRRVEQGASPAQGRVEGGAPFQRYEKSYVPTGWTINPGGSIEANGFSPDKFFGNAHKLLPKLKGTKWDLYGGVNDPQLVKDLQGYAKNHANGWRGDGSAPIEGTPLTPSKPTPAYQAYRIAPERFAVLNALMGNETARVGKLRPTAEKLEKQALARLNAPFLDPETAETNAVREHLGDWRKNLESTWETLRPELVERVREPDVNDPHTLRPSGFTGDRSTLAMRGIPRSDYVAAGFMPSDSEFLSPNQGEMTFDEAQKALFGPTQLTARKVASDIESSLGLTGHSRDAIGDWSDGAENSIVHRVQDYKDLDQLRYAAAIEGKELNQKAVLAFEYGDGPDTVHEIVVPTNDLGQIRNRLNSAGVQYRTLVPEGNSTRVMVVDLGNALADNVSKFASDYGAQVETSGGRGEFVGESNTREGAQANYAKIISDYEAEHADAPRYSQARGPASDRGSVADLIPEITEVPASPGRTYPITLPELAGHAGQIIANRATLLNYNGFEVTQPDGSKRYFKLDRDKLLGFMPDVTRPENPELEAIDKRWAEINNELLPLVHEPNSPRALKLYDELHDLAKQMVSLKARHPTPRTDPRARQTVIVGGGPGGLSTAMANAADGVDALVLEANPQTGGQSRFSSRIENYPGFPIGVEGTELARDMFEQTNRLGAEVRTGTRVTGIDFDPTTGIKTVRLANGETIPAHTVVVAGGTKWRKLDFPGSDSPSVVYGNGPRVGVIASGKPAVIIGGSNGAAQAALGAARRASKVTLMTRSPIEKSMSEYQQEAIENNPKIEVVQGDEIARLDTDQNGNATQVVTKGGKTIPAAALGIFAGGSPNTEWLPPSIRRARNNALVVDPGTFETSMPGVFAIGDITENGLGRIGAAVGDGQRAARSVFNHLETLEQADKLAGAAATTPSESFPGETPEYATGPTEEEVRERYAQSVGQGLPLRQEAPGGAGGLPPGGLTGIPGPERSSFMPAVSSLGFYSPLEKTIEEKMPNKASVDQIRGILKSSGVKPDEIKWSGIEDFLKSWPESQGQPTKEAVLGWLRANNVQVREVRKSDNYVSPRETARDENDPRDPDNYTQQVRDTAEEAQMDAAERALDDWYWEPPRGWGIEEIEPTEAEQATHAAGHPELFGGVTPPLPSKWTVHIDDEPLTAEEVKEWAGNRSWRQRYVPDTEGPDGEAIWDSWEDADEFFRMYTEEGEVAARDEAYSQWLRENPIEDFVEDAAREHGEHLDQQVEPDEDSEEATGPQNEQGVTGPARHSGYQMRGPKSNYGNLLLVLPDKYGHFDTPGAHWNEKNVLAHVRYNDRELPGGGKTLFIEELQSDWAQQGRQGGFAGDPVPTKYQIVETRGPGQHAFNIIDEHGVARWGGFETREQAQEELDANTQRRAARADDRPPVAPFVTNTDQWTKLALRRMIRYAAERGYDSISWTPGDIQADRWHFKNFVKGISVAKTADDSFSVFTTNKDSSPVAPVQPGDWTPHEAARNLPASRLADFIGKDLAGKVVEHFKNKTEKPAEFFGDDLTVGGEGFRGYYDRIMPKIANEIGKKFGAKVETSEVAGTEAWSLPITKEMKESVLNAGQPLFMPEAGKPEPPGPSRRQTQLETLPLRGGITAGQNAPDWTRRALTLFGKEEAHVHDPTKPALTSREENEAERLHARIEREFGSFEDFYSNMRRGSMTSVGQQGQSQEQLTGMEALPKGVHFMPTAVRTQAGPEMRERQQASLNYLAKQQQAGPEFKRWFGKSQITDGEGRPAIVYHQTIMRHEKGIMKEGFDTSKLGGREGDPMVPDGVFLKPSTTWIPVTGYHAVQLPLYAKIEHPLVVKTRQALVKWGGSKDKDYAGLLDDYQRTTKIINGPGGDDWKIEHGLFDSDAITKYVEENWTEPARAKLTAALRANGYDGVVIEDDVGSAGIGTKAIIALDPTQVKSAVHNTGAFDPDDPHIQFMPVVTGDSSGSSSGGGVLEMLPVAGAADEAAQQHRTIELGHKSDEMDDTHQKALESALRQSDAEKQKEEEERKKKRRSRFSIRPRDQ